MKYLFLTLLIGLSANAQTIEDRLSAIEARLNAFDARVATLEASVPTQPTGPYECRCEFVPRGKVHFYTKLNLYRVTDSGHSVKVRELASWDGRFGATCRNRMAQEAVCNP